MRPILVRWAVPAIAVVLLAVMVGVVYAAIATSRPVTLDGREAGEVLVDGQVVFRVRTDAGGFTAEQRAAQVADRLNDALQAGAGPQDVRATTVAGNQVVMARDMLIITADTAEAAANGLTPEQLAREWQGNLVVALGGERPPSGPPPREGDVDWTGQADKVVPILSVGTPGISLGAARVSGPRDKIAATKAVAQLNAEFQRTARIRAFIPVSDLNITRPKRVQGVSVNALIDMRLVGF